MADLREMLGIPLIELVEEYVDEIVEGTRHLEVGEAWEEVIQAVWNIEGYLARRGLWVEEEVVLEAGLRAARAIGNREKEGVWLCELGSNLVRRGDVLVSIEYYEQALAISREIGDRSVEGHALGSLGNAYASLGDYEAGLKHLLPGLVILQSIESPDAQVVKNNIAILRKKLGERKFKALLGKVSKELGLELK